MNLQKEAQERQARALRAQGSPFAICYVPRKQAKPCTAPKKTGPKTTLSSTPKATAAKPKYDQSNHAKMLRDPMESKSSTFCTAIATQADSDKTQRIKGKPL